MLNESLRNETDSGADMASAFRASMMAARRQQVRSWLLSGAWLVAILGIALYFSSQVVKINLQLQKLKTEVDHAQRTSEAARVNSLGVPEVRSMVFALQGSLERKAEVEGRPQSPSDKERYILKLVE